jgi:hypothetical protein
VGLQCIISAAPRHISHRNGRAVTSVLIQQQQQPTFATMAENDNDNDNEVVIVEEPEISTRDSMMSAATKFTSDHKLTR